MMTAPDVGEIERDPMKITYRGTERESGCGRDGSISFVPRQESIDLREIF
jgi:hypothetical protein